MESELNIALIHKYRNRNNRIDDYSRLLVDSMDSGLWNKIIHEAHQSRNSLNSKNNRFSILNSILKNDLLYIMKSYFDWINFLITEENVNRVFLTLPTSLLDERLILLVSMIKGIEINRYDEIINPNLFKKHKFINRINATYSFMLFLVKDGIDIRFLYLKNIYYENYFSFFPRLNPNINYHNLIKLSYDFKETTFDYNRHYSLILLTSPLYEKGKISLKAEMSYYNQLSKEIGRPIYVKFHPKDSEEKKILILSNSYYLKFPSEYSNIPFESCLEKITFDKLFGFDSVAMLFVSEFSNKQVITLLDLDKSYKISNKIDLIRSEFRNIKEL
jgi:hypothetical protein